MKLKDFDFRIWDGEKYINLKNDGGNDSITHRCEGYAIGLIGDEKTIYNIKAGVEYNGYTYDDYKYVENLSVDENKCEIELFTGFYDKNDKKIYEGDIIIFNDIVYDTNRIGVMIKRHSGEFRLKFSKNDTLGLIILNESDLLVIGNIHENSELIKEIE
ncbi:YopX family protein [Campylobacter coli]